ncbi:MAG: glycosyltransferase family 2 protein, partial [Bauldia sp.]
MLAAKTRALAGSLKTLKKSGLPVNSGLVLCHVRDEIELLPHFLTHYRSLGVRRFAFVDNGSIDSTLPFLLDQADCDVFQFLGDFREAAAGMIWKNLLMTEYRAAPWFLSVDADEHAVYDGWPDLPLDDFASAMNRNGLAAVTAIMVDMYGPGPVRETVVADGASFFDVSPLFDGEGYSVSMPDDWRGDSFPRLVIRGGPIERLLGAEKSAWWVKTPLILEPGISFHDPHSVYPPALNFVAPRIALLHFRWLAS